MYVFTNLSTTQLGQRLLEVALKFLCPYFFPNFNLSKLWKTMNYAPFKVHIFGEGHKILRNIHLTFDKWMAIAGSKGRKSFLPNYPWTISIICISIKGRDALYGLHSTLVHFDKN